MESEDSDGFNTESDRGQHREPITHQLQEVQDVHSIQRRRVNMATEGQSGRKL